MSELSLIVRTGYSFVDNLSLMHYTADQVMANALTKSILSYRSYQTLQLVAAAENTKKASYAKAISGVIGGAVSAAVSLGGISRNLQNKGSSSSANTGISPEAQKLTSTAINVQPKKGGLANADTPSMEGRSSHSVTPQPAHRKATTQERNASSVPTPSSSVVQPNRNSPSSNDPKSPTGSTAQDNYSNSLISSAVGNAVLQGAQGAGELAAAGYTYEATLQQTDAEQFKAAAGDLSERRSTLIQNSQSALRNIASN